MPSPLQKLTKMTREELPAKETSRRKLLPARQNELRGADRDNWKLTHRNCALQLTQPHQCARSDTKAKRGITRKLLFSPPSDYRYKNPQLNFTKTNPAPCTKHCVLWPRGIYSKKARMVHCEMQGCPVHREMTDQPRITRIKVEGYTIVSAKGGKASESI